MSEHKWIDISQSLTNNIAVWPGDSPYHFEISYTKDETGSVNIGQMTTSVHTGTHIDAPFHFAQHGQQVHELDVNTYIGKARVIDVSEYEIINQAVLSKFDLTNIHRLILKTEKYRDETVFPAHFTVIDPEIGAYLQERNIYLLGTDAPSVDAEKDQTVQAHHALHEHGVFILENLMLNDIEPADYELIALPLKIVGADGSPVRAVIRRI